MRAVALVLFSAFLLWLVWLLWVDVPRSETRASRPAATHVSADPPAAIVPSHREERRATQPESAVEPKRVPDTAADEIARLRLELHRCRNSDSPYGLFLLQIRPGQYTDKELKEIELWLDYFPVHLSVEEADWLLEREKHGDWLEWGESQWEAVLHFLGPARVQSQVSPEKWKEIEAAS